MQGISLRDDTCIEKIRKRTEMDNAASKVGHLARHENAKWTKSVVQWWLMEHKRSTGRAPKLWLDDIMMKVGHNWHQLAQDRGLWKTEEVSFVKEWAQTGC